MKFKFRAAMVWLVGILTAVGALCLAWFLGLGKLFREREKRAASAELAAELKNKVAKLHAEEVERKATTAVEVKAMVWDCRTWKDWTTCGAAL